MTIQDYTEQLAATGVHGLDTILDGGLPQGRVYLLEGKPGSGKTTLGIQFLLQGLLEGERVMLVSLIETREELVQMARSHGWRLEGIHLLELPQSLKESAAAVQTVFPPGDIEFGEAADAVIAAVEAYKPQRLLLDSISQLAMLTDSRQQMRGSILKLREVIHRLGCTAILTSSEFELQDIELDTIVHGTIALGMKIPAYGRVRRELVVKKLRGHLYITGKHNYRIRTGGLEVYSWPTVRENAAIEHWQVMPSGIQGLDDLLGGGLEEGTTCLVTGSTGAGKSTLGSLYVQAAARRNERSVIFCFDERKDTFLRRSASLNLEMPKYVDQGLVELVQIGAGQYTPGEFAHQVHQAVENQKVRVVVIDSVTGYLNAIPGEEPLMTQIHELLSYLSGKGVLTILIISSFGLSGMNDPEVDASYIADTVILLRHFEALGRIRRCIAVVKKRHGRHEHTIREFKIAAGGCEVGPPLSEFNGVLTGTPTFIGDIKKLL